MRRSRGDGLAQAIGRDPFLRNKRLLQLGDACDAAWERPHAEREELDRAVMAVSGAFGPFSGPLDDQPLFAAAQRQGISSSMRLWGQPLTRRVSTSRK